MKQALQTFSSQYLRDLTEVKAELASLHSKIEGKRFYITGGTGFLGHWLTDSLLLMGAHVTVATRSASAALKNSPYWNDAKNLKWVEIKNGIFPDSNQPFDFVIHAAMDLTHSAQQAVDFANQVFDLTKTTHAKSLLLISSGAVHLYSKTKPTRYRESEEIGSPPADAHAYSAGKQLVEQEAQKRALNKEFELKIARGYTYIGPFQDLKSHHAASMFLSSVIQGEPIVIEGDGLTERAFLYPSEFAIGAIKVLFEGKNQDSYNIGASKSSTILELANLINECRKQKPPPVQVLNKATTSLSQVNAYAANMEKMKSELNFIPKISLKEAIQRTARFYSERFPHSQIEIPRSN